MTKQIQKSKCCNEPAKKNTKRDGYRCSKCKKDCEIKIEKKKGKRGLKKSDNAVVSKKTVEVVETGRPTVYSEELADEICERLSSGRSLLNICGDKDIPGTTTIYRWLLDDEKKDFWDKYARARNMQAEKMFDELLNIADDGQNDWMEIQTRNGSIEVINQEVMQRSRLRVDTRKWYLSKVLPKKFGEKVDITSGGERIQSNSITFINFGEKKDEK